MDYNTTNILFQNIVQTVLDNKLLAALIWIAFMYFILRRVAKSDYDLILKKKWTRDKLSLIHI